MSKRKVVAGGYEDSSDGLEAELVDIPDPSAKKAKPAPYVPPRLGVAARAPNTGPSGFKLPASSRSASRGSVPPGSSASLLRSGLSSARGSAPPELGASPTAFFKPTTGSVLTPRDTPEPQKGQSIEDGSLSDSDSERVDRPNPSANAGSKATVNAPEVQLTNKSTSARFSLAFERQLNDLANAFEEYKNLSDEQHKQTDTKLTRLLEAMERGVTSEDSISAPALVPLASISPTATEKRTYLSNPLPTLELIAIVSKVVAEARSRVGKKKGGADDNSLKEHARTTFYRMLCIVAARFIRPYFEDEHGEPDTLPAQFVDPETNYCQPYPHWKASLAKQVAWIPTFILRFRSTIPNDQSELSNVLRGLSDEQIVILLHDGPFKSAQTAWRDMKKTDEELEIMRANARKYQRAEKKATICGRYIQTIPSLQGTEWEYLSQSGYMSQDESDGEGGYRTKQPDHRATWETNLFKAIRAAEIEKARSRHGLCPRLPRYKVEIVKRPIPHLERGTGGSKVTLRIPLCGISKTWRDKNPGDLKKYGHLINTRIVAKPDISAFLAQHPMTNISDGEDSDDEWGLDAATKHPEVDAGYDGGVGKDQKSWEDVGEGEVNVGDVGGGSDESQGNGHVRQDHYFPIDPQLQEGRTHIDNDELRDQILSGTITRQGCIGDQPAQNLPSYNQPPEQVGHQHVLEPTQGLPNFDPPNPSVQMPPPPPLDSIPLAGPSNVVKASAPPKKRGRPPKNADAVAPIPTAPGDVAEPQLIVVQAPDNLGPKKRGRPAGSKNKPKV